MLEVVLRFALERDVHREDADGHSEDVAGAHGRGGGGQKTMALDVGELEGNEFFEEGAGLEEGAEGYVRAACVLTATVRQHHGRQPVAHQEAVVEEEEEEEEEEAPPSCITSRHHVTSRRIAQAERLLEASVVGSDGTEIRF